MDLPVDCSCAAPVAAAVGATFLALLAVQALLYLIWKLHSRANSGQHLVLVTDTERGDLYAYDNPGFKDGPSIVHAEKENQKENQTLIKWPQWASIGLIPSSNKIKAMDDSFTTQPVISVVPLRSHDFTGLGFNICGNMRDGIFVKDVLHRGPASESGRIMPGDRIESVKVSLRHMVFEDALTILSYASPYEVELAVEARRGSRAPSLVRSHRSPSHRIGHPFFRSRSIADLQQIEKSSGRRLAGDGADAVDAVECRGRSEERLQNSRNAALEATSATTSPAVPKSPNASSTPVRKPTPPGHSLSSTTIIVPDRPERRRAASPVRTILARGIQTLRHRLHPSPPRHSEQPPYFPGEVTVEKQSEPDIQKDDDGWQTAELCVPDHVEHAGSVARAKRLSAVEDDDSKQKSQGPPPPQVDIQGVEEESVGDLNSSMSGTIELDSSLVIVHQSDEGRKASSLGDLSRWGSSPDTGTGSLERAASLEAAAAAAGGRKRKAPPVPRPPSPDGAPSSEATVPPGSGTLRKANLWGTLEDALSPMVNSPTEKSSSNVWASIEDISPPAILKKVDTAELWSSGHVNGGTDDGHSSEDETPPLPTSPVPLLNYVTEIQVDGSAEQKESKPLMDLKREMEQALFSLDEISNSTGDLNQSNNNNNNDEKESNSRGGFLSLHDMRSCDLSLCLDDREGLRSGRESSEDTGSWSDAGLSGRLSRSTGNLSGESPRLSLASPGAKRSAGGRGGSRIPVRRSPHTVRHAQNGHHSP